MIDKLGSVPFALPCDELSRGWLFSDCGKNPPEFPADVDGIVLFARPEELVSVSYSSITRLLCL